MEITEKFRAVLLYYKGRWIFLMGLHIQRKWTARLTEFCKLPLNVIFKTIAYKVVLP